MLNAVAFPPIIDLMFAGQRLVANRTVGRNVLFIAGVVTGLLFVNVEAPLCYRLLADSAAKMRWMPGRIDGIDEVAINWLRTAFADAG